MRSLLSLMRRLAAAAPRVQVVRTGKPEHAARLVIKVNYDVKLSRGKYAAQAVHAALLATGARPGVPVVVLGASRDEIEQMPVQVHDAGRTEVAPGTLTAGAAWQSAEEAAAARADRQ